MAEKITNIQSSLTKEVINVLEKTGKTISDYSKSSITEFIGKLIMRDGRITSKPEIILTCNQVYENLKGYYQKPKTPLVGSNVIDTPNSNQPKKSPRKSVFSEIKKITQ